MSRRPLQTMTITVDLRDDEDVELDVSYDVHPGERMTRYSPGCSDELEIVSISRDGKDITTSLNADERDEIDRAVRETAAEEATRAAEDYAAERHARRFA